MLALPSCTNQDHCGSVMPAHGVVAPPAMHSMTGQGRLALCETPMLRRFRTIRAGGPLRNRSHSLTVRLKERFTRCPSEMRMPTGSGSAASHVASRIRMPWSGVASLTGAIHPPLARAGAGHCGLPPAPATAVDPWQALPLPESAAGS